MNAIGVLAAGQGRGEEAKEFYMRAIEMGKRVVGETHSDTLTSMSKLAKTYKALGK